MNKLTYILVLICFLPIQQIISQQRQTDQVIIPLSKTGQPGSLNINHFGGFIKVFGYDGSNVIIDASQENKQDNSSKSGIKK